MFCASTSPRRQKTFPAGRPSRPKGLTFEPVPPSSSAPRRGPPPLFRIPSTRGEMLQGAVSTHPHHPNVPGKMQARRPIAAEIRLLHVVCTPAVPRAVVQPRSALGRAPVGKSGVHGEAAQRRGHQLHVQVQHHGRPAGGFHGPFEATRHLLPCIDIVLISAQSTRRHGTTAPKNQASTASRESAAGVQGGLRRRARAGHGFASASDCGRRRAAREHPRRAWCERGAAGERGRLLPGWRWHGAVGRLDAARTRHGRGARTPAPQLN